MFSPRHSPNRERLDAEFKRHGRIEAHARFRKGRAEIDANPRSGNAPSFAAVKHGSPVSAASQPDGILILLYLPHFEMILWLRTAAGAGVVDKPKQKRGPSPSRAISGHEGCSLHCRQTQHAAKFVRLALAALARLTWLVG